MSEPCERGRKSSLDGDRQRAANCGWRYDNRLAKKLPFADAFSVSISRPGGFPKKRLYSRLNWLGLS